MSSAGTRDGDNDGTGAVRS